MQFPIPEATVGTFVKQASLVQKLDQDDQIRYVCDVVLSIMDREAVQSGQTPQANFIFTGGGATPDEAIKAMFDKALLDLQLR